MAAAEKGSKKSASQRRLKTQRVAKQKQYQSPHKPRRAVRIARRKGSPHPRSSKGPRTGKRSMSTQAQALMASFVNDIYKQVSAEARRQRRPVAPKAAPKASRTALPEPPAPVPEASP